MAPEVMHVQAKGQVTIDRRVREELGIQPGDEVVWVKNDAGRFELWKVETLQDEFDRAAEGFATWAASVKPGYGPRRGPKGKP